MTLVFRFCYMSSVRSTSDGRGPVTRKRVPDREDPGKPRKDARRGRCHLLEAGLWSLWMTPLPRYPSRQVTKYVHRVTVESGESWVKQGRWRRDKGLITISLLSELSIYIPPALEDAPKKGCASSSPRYGGENYRSSFLC
jgi:hypothetical protein